MTAAPRSCIAIAVMDGSSAVTPPSQRRIDVISAQTGGKVGRQVREKSAWNPGVIHVELVGCFYSKIDCQLGSAISSLR